LETGDTSAVTNLLTGKRDELTDAATKVFSDANFNFGSVGEIFMSALQSGLFSPFGDLDMNDGETKFRAMIGQLGQDVTKAFNETPVEVTPKTTVTPGEVDASKVPAAVEAAAKEEVAGKAAEVNLGVNFTPTVSADTLNYNLRAANGSETGEQYASGLSDSTDAAKNAAKGIAVAAAKALSSQGAGAMSAGRNFGQKFIQGMSSMMPSIREKARQMAREAIAAANAGLSGGGGGGGGGTPKGLTKGLQFAPSGIDASLLDGYVASYAPSGRAATGGVVSGTKALETSRPNVTLHINNPSVRSDRDARNLIKEANRYFGQVSAGYGGRRGST